MVSYTRPTFYISNEPFLLLKKFTPTCVLAEDRDGAGFSKEHESFVYLFTMEYVTSRTISLCVSIHIHVFIQSSSKSWKERKKKNEGLIRLSLVSILSFGLLLSYFLHKVQIDSWHLFFS